MDLFKNEKTVRVVTYAVLAVIALIVVYVILKKLSKLSIFGGKSEAEEKYEKQLEKDAKELPPTKPENRSFKQLKTYNTYANLLYGAIKDGKAGFGLNDEMIRSVFKPMKTTSDLIELKRAFGLRDNQDLDLYLINKVPPDWKYTLWTFGGVTVAEINEILRDNNLKLVNAYKKANPNKPKKFIPIYQFKTI